MLKKDLIDLVAREADMPKKTVGKVMDAILHVSIDALMAGKEVRLFGIGKLYVSRRGPKVARDLHTGARVIVPPRNAVVMAPSDVLVKSVNAGGTA